MGRLCRFSELKREAESARLGVCGEWGADGVEGVDAGGLRVQIGLERGRGEVRVCRRVGKRLDWSCGGADRVTDGEIGGVEVLIGFEGSRLDVWEAWSGAARMCGSADRVAGQ